MRLSVYIQLMICPTSVSFREEARILAFEARQLISQRGLSRFSDDGREQKGTRVEDGLFLAAQEEEEIEVEEQDEEEDDDGRRTREG